MAARTLPEKRAHMKVLNFSRYAVGISSAIVMLAGCGGSQAQVGVPSTIQSERRDGPASRPQRFEEETRGSSGSAFTVSGRFILLNGNKFYVKGMVYSPTPIGNGVSDPPSLDDPLRDDNSGIWSRDLPLMRAMGVNVIHIYNVVPPPYDDKTGPISKWLDAAWNNGTNPVYVLLTVYFDGRLCTTKIPYEPCQINTTTSTFKYAGYPAVMGVVISNEIIKPDWWDSATWWKNFNRIADARAVRLRQRRKPG